MLNKYIRENRLPILERTLKNQFSEIFAEDIENFISLQDNETIITNDSNSLKVDQVAKILKGDSTSQNLRKVLNTESINSLVKSIIKLNIQV